MDELQRAVISEMFLFDTQARSPYATLKKQTFQVNFPLRVRDMLAKKAIIFLFPLTIFLYWSLSFPPALGAGETKGVKTISTGTDLPEFKLDAPGSIKEQKYLGLPESKPFSFSQILAKLTVLEVFSVYCPHCRRQAPALNKIYGFIKQDPKLSHEIKMVGIGAGCTKSQLAGWKSALHVPFPLFQDPEGNIWKKFGKPGVPCTLVVSGTGKILAIHLGPTKNIEEFFGQIKKLSSAHP